MQQRYALRQRGARVRSEPVARSEARSEVVIAAFVFSERSVFLIFRRLQKSRSSPSLAKPHYPLLSRPRKGTGGHFLHNEVAIAKLLLVPAPVPVWGAQESIVRIPTSVAATFVVCACCSTGSWAEASLLSPLLAAVGAQNCSSSSMVPASRARTAVPSFGCW